MKLGSSNLSLNESLKIIKSDKKKIGRLIAGMKNAYTRNENVIVSALSVSEK